jgi:hypothetical protein
MWEAQISPLLAKNTSGPCGKPRLFIRKAAEIECDLSRFAQEEK